MADRNEKAKSTTKTTTTLPSLYLAEGSESSDISDAQLRDFLSKFLDSLGERDEILILPPDFSRFHSQAGKITKFICEHYKCIPTKEEDNVGTKDGNSQIETNAETTTGVGVPNIEILPALGTHAPMTVDEIRKMFGEELAQKSAECFFVHDWRNDVVTIGEVPNELVLKATYNAVDRTWPVQLNKMVWAKRLANNNNKPRRPLVLSIGQVVPHEVMGMSNFNKNLFVGTGGVEAINLSHFIGAVHGMERMMGRKDNPLRDILNHASQHFLQNELDLWYILTVVSPLKEGESSSSNNDDNLCLRGLYIGRDVECYSQACDLSLKVNFTVMDKPISRCVVYLDPHEFHSTWLGNKAIYRTRMAMADQGRLIILAPGVKRFGEDDQVDKLIRKYGYKGTPITMQQMKDHVELQDNLSAVAHLIHGSSEGRFHITYCPGHLTRDEIISVGFDYDDLDQVSQRYNVATLQDGWNTDEKGEFYFISKPALGLWAVESRFQEDTV
ncbi:hypothetical protein ACA910_005317 [Epithemia clementina (nom. ined.)]